MDQQKQRLEAYHQRIEDEAQERAKALQSLIEAGLDHERADNLLAEALEKDRDAQVRPLGVEGESEIQRTNRAWAAMDTVVALFTGDWPSIDGEEPEPTEIALSLIDCDRSIQIRVAGLDEERVDNYAARMKAGDEFPPIVTFFHGDDDDWHLWLSDGYHRYAAMLRTQDYTAPVLVYAGTRQEAEEYAAICNAHHGLPLSNEDKWAAARRLLGFHPEWSNREVARRLGVSHPFVGKVRKKMEAEAEASGNDFQMPEERVVKRGDQTYEYMPPEPEPAPGPMQSPDLEMSGDPERPGSTEAPLVQFEASESTRKAQEPAEEALPKSRVERIKNALVAGDWQHLRSLIADSPPDEFMNALQVVFTMGKYAEWKAATECLMKALTRTPSRALPGETDRTCPECGGRVVPISGYGTSSRVVCLNCGAVIQGDDTEGPDDE